MPRTMRVKSETGVYHVMLRGINKQTIFNDSEDFEKFLSVIKECKAISEFELFAYCLMSNHVHLLIKENKEDLAMIFKRIGVRYVCWYNWKYSRRGHLFQDRFKSEVVENDEYFLTVLRYIHQNPTKAGIVKAIDEYTYSSYNDYIEKDGSLTELELAIEILGEENFATFNNEKNEDKCLEDDNSEHRISDLEGRKIIKETSGAKNIEQFLKLTNDEKKASIMIFKEKGMSIRQISRLTGVSFGVVRGIE